MASRTCSLSPVEIAFFQHDLSALERLGQPRLAQRENGRLASGRVSWSRGTPTRTGGFPGIDRQETGEALGEDFGLAVTDPDLEAKEQARCLGLEARQGLGRRDPHVLLRIGQRVHQQGQVVRASDPRQGDQGRGTQGCGGVRLSAPDRLELHVTSSLSEDLRPPVLQLVQRLDDGDLGAAELVILVGIDEEAIEGRFQVGGQLDVALFRPRPPPPPRQPGSTGRPGCAAARPCARTRAVVRGADESPRASLREISGLP